MKIIGLKKDILHYGKADEVIIVNNNHANYIINSGRGFLIEDLDNKRIKNKKQYLEKYITRDWSFSKWLNRLHSFVGKGNCEECGEYDRFIWQQGEVVCCYSCMKAVYNELKKDDTLWGYIKQVLGWGFQNK